MRGHSLDQEEAANPRLPILDKFPLLTLSALEGSVPSIAWGGGQFDPHIWQLPGAYKAIILSILIIILFKERINDYLEKKWVNILKIGRNIAIFVGQEIFWKILRISFFQTWNHRYSAIS